MTLPIFTGDITSKEDIASYITSPTNLALATQNELIASLIADVATKPDFFSDAVEPTVAKKGDRWTSSVTGQRKECVETYLVTEPNKASKWLLTAGEVASQQVQLQANESQLNGAFIDQTFNDFGANSVISPTEKAIINSYYTEAVNEKPDIDASAQFFQILASSEYTDYVTKWTNLTNYVTTETILDDLNVDTSINSVAWNTAWNEFRVARTAVRNLLLTKSNSIVEDLSGDIDNVGNQIDTMSNDSIISPQEKVRLLKEWNDVITINKLKLYALSADLGVTTDTEYTLYVDKYDALELYLNTTITLFATMSADTDLVALGTNSAIFQARFNDYYVAESALDKFLDNRFETNINDNKTEYLALIDEVIADNKISGGSEKQQVQQTWKDIESENARLILLASQYSVTVPTTYTTSFTDLDFYLNTTLGLFTDMNATTNINATVFYTNFNTYRAEADAFSELIVIAQKVAVETGNPDFAVVQQQVQDLLIDGLITAGAEKIRAISIWQDIQASHASFLAQASKTGVSTTAIQAKYDQLEAYLNALTPSGGGTPNFLVTGETTSVGSGPYFSNFQQYYVARDDTVKQVIDALSDGLTSVSQSILDVNNDGIVTVIEKKTVQQQITEFTAEVASLDTQADNLGIVTSKNAMDTAWNTLNTYLDSLDGGNGLFFDMNVSTTLSAGEQNQWDIDFSNFFATKTALETEIITTVQANVVSLNLTVLNRNGTVTMTGNLDMETGGVKNHVINMAEYPVGATNHGATVNQVYTEQLARAQAITDEETARDLAIAVAVTSREGQPSGLATLGVDGKIPNGQIPALAISEIFSPIADDTARDAISPVETGDVAIVTTSAEAGNNKATYIHNGTGWILMEDGLTTRVTNTETVANNALAKSGGNSVATQNLTIDKAVPVLFLDDTGGSNEGSIRYLINGLLTAKIGRKATTNYTEVVTTDANIAMDFNSKLLVNVKDPINDQDGASKKYVDDTASSSSTDLTTVSGGFSLNTTTTGAGDYGTSVSIYKFGSTLGKEANECTTVDFNVNVVTAGLYLGTVTINKNWDVNIRWRAPTEAGSGNSTTTLAIGAYLTTSEVETFQITVKRVTATSFEVVAGMHIIRTIKGYFSQNKFT